jgi:hypothetical protein
VLATSKSLWLPRKSRITPVSRISLGADGEGVLQTDGTESVSGKSRLMPPAVQSRP